MLTDVRAGDFVIIQFGHNDSGAVNQEPPGSTQPLRARGTIPGIGNESEEIDNVITGKHETVYSFGWYLRKMIADTRAKGATPILLTLTKTNNWKDGRIPCAAESYRLWTWQTATSEKVAFVDLTRMIARSLPARRRGRGHRAVHRRHQCTPTSRARKPTRATRSPALRAIKTLAVRRKMLSERRPRRAARIAAPPKDFGAARSSGSLVARKADHRFLRQEGRIRPGRSRDAAAGCTRCSARRSPAVLRIVHQRDEAMRRRMVVV